ncbi:MAG: tRNA dimethylallyltransferase [Bacteroidia bacterium]|jgi:tRNA dimethylallyltransferase
MSSPKAPISKQLLVVGGATASGKTSLAIALAGRLNTEIISADSRQFYKELNIGVARPSAEELALVPHHFISSRSITEPYSAGKYALDALAKIDELFAKADHVVLVGGSGLFIEAVTHGFHEQEAKDSTNIRKELQDLHQEEGIEALQNILKGMDPSHYKMLDTKNPHRLMRAIERVRVTGKTHLEQVEPPLVNRPFKTNYVAIEWPRADLYDRINQRVDVMMKKGLLDEVKSVYAHRDQNALKTVGYKELFDYMDGIYTLPEAIDKIKQNTRRYAKRQLTWFKNKTTARWYNPHTAADEIVADLSRW